MIFSFLTFLKNNHIDFIIINGYIDLIANVDRTNDNDILFKKQDFKNIDSILRKFCKEYNFTLVQKMHHDIYAKNFFIYSSELKSFLNLDLYGEISKEGIVLYDEKEIFNSINYYENFPILSTEKDFFTYLIKKLYKGDLNKSNFSFLRYLYLKDKNSCISLIKKYFTKNNSIINKSFDNDNFDLLNSNRKIIISEFLDNKKFHLSIFIFNKLRVLKRIQNPTGLTIGLLGPDGSGKSTIINTIISSILPFRRNDYFHLKPKFNKSINSNLSVEEPHKNKPYSSLKSYIKLLLFLFQYNFGWLKNILKLKIKSSLIIFDRYYDDMLVDSKRYRYGGNLSFAKFMRNFIPKPDLYFILTTDADIIYKRKQEVPFEELERQITEYRQLADNKKYFNIDVNRTPEEISNEIIEIMMRKMNERF